jgi:CDP-6-deoxy-D-xylo-4-hexulose-3-dehydrase
MQAACGLAQLERLPEFIQTRKKNFDFLKNELSKLEEFLILPAASSGSDPSWFGFPITLKKAAPVNRLDLLTYLDQAKVGTRLLFAGNLTRQPSLKGQTFRIASNLTNTDLVMQNTFWVGVQPALDRQQLNHAVNHINSYVAPEF